MTYDTLLDFDTSYLPLDYWDYNPEWDVTPEEREAFDLLTDLWYNEEVEKSTERNDV